jgi:small GTP-binding protein
VSNKSVKKNLTSIYKTVLELEGGNCTKENKKKRGKKTFFPLTPFTVPSPKKSSKPRKEQTDNDDDDDSSSPAAAAAEPTKKSKSSKSSGGKSTAAASAAAASASKKDEQQEGGEQLSGATRMKLVVVGDGAVGKTSLLIVYATGKFPSQYLPTVFENYTAQMQRGDDSILLHLWDTAGQEDYDRLRPLSYPGSDIVLLCFSLVNKASYEAVRDKWAPEVHHYVPDIPHVLVGLKADLRDAGEKDPNTGKHQPISSEQGEAMKKEIGAVHYAEVSAKTKDGVTPLFEHIVDIVLKVRAEAEAGADGDDDDEQGTIVTSKKKKKKGCALL